MFQSLRKLSIFIIVLVILILPISVRANPDTVYISLAKGDEYSLFVGDSVVFGWGWATISKGLTNHFVRFTSQGWMLRDSDGIKLADFSSQGMEGWGDLYEYQIPASWNCPGKWSSGEKYGWAMHWDQDPTITFNDPGVFYLDFYWILEHQLRDPCDINDDGEPDIYETGTNTITIIVSE